MPRVVSPARWEHYDRLRHSGHSRAQAARQAGISEPTARLFDYERKSVAAGIEVPRTSSGWQWLEWRAFVGPEQAAKVGMKASA